MDQLRFRSAEQGLNRTDHIRYVIIGEFGREGQADRLATDAHRGRVVLRAPAKSVLIIRMLGNT